MKIYVLCDLEGVAGVADQAHQCSFIHDSYEREYRRGVYGDFYLQARRLATLELNALVEGALEGGATEIIAWDGHCRFPGGLDVELLHPECKLVMNAGDGGPVGMDESLDAIFTLGAHAKGGAPGASLAHGRFPGLEWNGEEIGEAGMACAQSGWLGVPLVFVSGDRAAVEEVRAFVPTIEAVIVKEALFTGAVDVMAVAPSLSLAPAKARALIRAGAKRAMTRIKEIPPAPKPPFNPMGV